MTITLIKPAPAADTPAAPQPSTELGCIATVSPSGRLRLPNAPSNQGAVAMSRRSRTGTTYRVGLGGGINCWLDGDDQDGNGELNWIATQMCTTLSGGAFTGPADAPFVCGLVLFTATAATGFHGTGLVGLSEDQLWRVVDAHATASNDDVGDPAPANLAHLLSALA
jgi:hypothetical protein